MDSFNNAASAFRPRPARSLKEPQAFLVHEASARPSALGSSASRAADTAAVRQSYMKKIELQKKALAWTESLLEENVSRADFKTACAHLTRTTYLHILHERHLLDLCSYPLCGRPPRLPYRHYAVPRSRIVTTASGGRIVVNVTGNDDDGFCGELCRRRAEWVSRVDGAFGDGLWQDDEADDVRLGRWQLLEEVEERPQVEENRPSRSTFEAAGVRPNTPEPVPAVIEPPTPAAPPPLVSDLLAALRIVENPTPLTAPCPPQLLPTPLDSEHPAGSTAPTPPTPLSPLSAQATTAQIREHERRRRADASNSSLVPTDILGFADSLITSTPPPPGGHADEEDESTTPAAEDERSAVAVAVDEEDAAWGLMEAARQVMHGPS